MKYTDRRGLEIAESQIQGWYDSTGISRKAFESAMEFALITPIQAAALLSQYDCIKPWCERDIETTQFVALDGFEFVGGAK